MVFADMSPEAVLEFDGGYVGPLRPEDVHPAYIAGLNDTEVNRYLVGVKYTTQTQENVVDFVKSNIDSASSVLFGIWEGKNPRHCGTIRLHGIENFHRTAHIGVCLFDKSAWGKHLGLKAITCVTQWSFETLKLRWVEAGIYDGNIASQKTFVTAGYQWVYDVADKYIFEASPTLVKVYAARNFSSR